MSEQAKIDVEFWGTGYSVRDGHEVHTYRAELRYAGRTMDVPEYGRGMGLEDEDPTAAELLDCIFGDALACEPTAEGAAGSFEEFCAAFGYDDDSRKAEAQYRACLEQTERLATLVGGWAQLVDMLYGDAAYDAGGDLGELYAGVTL